MTSKVENLVLEHLKRFQAQTTCVEDKVEQMATDLRGVKQHMAAFMGSEFSQDSEIASLTLRLERIERRLDLID